MLLKTLWHWVEVVGMLVGVVVVLKRNDLVLLDESLEVFVLEVSLVVVKSGLVSNLMGDELGVVS